MKRSYFLFGIIGIILLGAGAAFLLRRSGGIPLIPTPPPSGTLPPVAPAPPSQSTPQGNPPPPLTGQGDTTFGVITYDHDIFEYYVDTQQTVAFIRPDGKVFELRNGSATTLSDETRELASAAFSNDGKFLLVASRETTGEIFSVFSLDDKAWQPLPAGTQSGAWSPVSSTLALLVRQGNTSNLITYTPSTKIASQPLFSLHQEDAVLQWATPTSLLFTQPGSALYSGSVWRFDLDQRTFAPLLEHQLGLETAFYSKDAMGIAFIANKGNRGGKLVTFSERENPTLLSFLTLPSKCAFGAPAAPLPPASSTEIQNQTPATYNALLYCGVPRNADIIGYRSLPDDYNKHGLFTADDLYRIDLRDGSISLVFSAAAYDLDAHKLELFNETLFFINRLDRKLYAVELPS